MADFRTTPRGVLVGYSGGGGTVVVPDGTTKVGWAAFRGMPDIRQVSLPASVTEIDDLAFAGCSGLIQVAGPTGLRFVGVNAFQDTPRTIMAPPMRLTLQGSVLSWSAPAGDSAYSYTVFINGREVAVDVFGTSLDLAAFLTPGATNAIQVCAVGYYGQESLRSPILDVAVSPRAAWNTGSWNGVGDGVPDSVAASADGRMVFAGYTNRDLVRIFEEGALVAVLTCPVTAIASSADGQTLAVTAEDATRVFTWGESTAWTSVAELLAGGPLAISADGATIAIGRQDRVAIYTKRRLDGAWALDRELFGDAVEGGESFGCSVALSADGGVLAVGAKTALGDGVVRVYSGTLRVTLRGEEGSNEHFGHSVAISADGSRILVGAPCTGTPNGIGVAAAGYGTASLWVRSGDSWGKQVVFYGFVGGVNTQFGQSLALSADGITVAVGDLVGSVRVFVENGGGAWPQVAAYEGRTGSVAISCTGDLVAFRTGEVATIRAPGGGGVGPSPATMLRLAAGDVEGAARGLARDIQTSSGVLDIQRFTSALTPGGADALAVMLVASNLLPESLNALKGALFSECVGTLGFPTDTYISVGLAYIGTVIQSVPAENRDAAYYPTTLHVFFPSDTVVTPDPAYTNVIYCLTPDTDYTFGDTVVNYKRTSEASKMLLSLPGSGAYIPSSGGPFSPSATVWRIANTYGGVGLLESAMTLVATDPTTFRVADYVRIAWLTTDMTLSADADTARVGRILSQKFLPYARGVRAVVEFVDSPSDVLRTGTFVNSADGSVRFASPLVLTRSSALTRIEPGAFDVEIRSVVLNGVTYEVTDGNIVLPVINDGLWTIIVNGTTILLPNAPATTAESVTIPRSLAHIPAGYLADSGVTTAVFQVAIGEDTQVIGAGAFPVGCTITVNEYPDQSFTYTGGALTRLGGVFYADYDSEPTVVWYPTPLRINGGRLAVPPRVPRVNFVCESPIMFVVTDDAQSDLFLWHSAEVDSRPLIADTLAHVIEYRAGSTVLRYANFPTSTAGASYSVASMYIYPLVKLLATYHAAHTNQANEGLTSLLGGFSADPAITVAIPHSGTTVADTDMAAQKVVRYRFTQSSLAEGQKFYHGNLAWTNSRSAAGSRILSALMTEETEGVVYFQAGAFSLYPHMFGPWRRGLVAVRETDGYDLVASNSSIPAYTFKDCVQLQEHAILYDRSVGASAFENCVGLRSIFAAGATTAGCLRGAAGQTTSVTVGVRAFKGCVGLTGVTIAPPSLGLEIGESAFEGCSGVTDVTLRSGGNMLIGRAAFRNCGALRQITLDASGSITLDASAFAGCSEVTTLRITSTGLTIAAGVFNNLAKLGEITITGRGAITIAERAFTGCCTAGVATMSITSSAGKVMINDYAFNGCSGIATVVVNASGEVMICDYAFNGCASVAPLTSRLAIDSSGSVTIAKNAFAGCTYLGPVSVQTTGMLFVFGGAFSGCYTATRSYGATVVLRGSRTSVDSTAFTGCTAVTAVTVTGLTTSNSFPFTAMTSLRTFDCTTANMLTLGTMAGHGALRSVIMSGVDLAIGSDQFTGCTQLQTVRIANTLTGMVANALSSCGALLEVALHFRDDASCIFGTLTASPLTSLQVTGGSVLTIPAGFCTSRGALTTVRLQSQVLLASGVTTVGNAFRGCNALASLSLETTDMVSTSAMIEIDQVLTGLVSLDISGNLNVSGTRRFWENSVLQSIRIRGTLMSDLAGIPKATIRIVDIRAAIPMVITEYQYMNAPALEVFKVNDLRIIEEGAFFGCTRLTTVDVGSKLEEIHDWAFANTGISGEVVMPTTLLGLGVGYFIGCPNLKRVTYKGSVFEFVDPTRIRSDIWNNYLYADEGVMAYDVCGEMMITKGSDDAYQVQYAVVTAGSVGPTQTIPKSTLYKNLNWSYLRQRTNGIELVIDTMMGYFRNNATATSVPGWIISPILQLKMISTDCDSIWNYNPNLATFGGWNPATQRFTTVDNAARGIDASGNQAIQSGSTDADGNWKDASGNSYISGSAYNMYELQIYPPGGIRGGNASANFASAIAANNALFTESAGATYISVPVPYKLESTGPQNKIRLLLPQPDILKIVDDMIVKRNGDDIVCEWVKPTITMTDNTIFEINGTLTRSLSSALSANQASVLRWILDNSTSVFGPNRVGISLLGLTSTIRNLDFKTDTSVEIRGGNVLINLNSMGTFVNSTLDIYCATSTIDNNAFICWTGGSKLRLRTLLTPNVGVEIFGGSENITIDSNKFLINSPIVHLKKIAKMKLDDVPAIVASVGIDPRKTRDTKIGVFLPEDSKVFEGYSYIEFQELPSLQMHYILQEPEDWFWTCRYVSDAGDKMEYVSRFTTDGAGNQNPGLVDRLAPATFTFAGYEFARTDDPSGALINNNEVVYRAVISTDDRACKDRYDKTVGGIAADVLTSIGINLGVSLLVFMLTLGFGFLIGKALEGAALLIARIIISITFEVIGVIVIQFIITYIDTGVVAFGELTYFFYFEIFIAIFFIIKFPKLKPKVIKPPDPATAGRWGLAKQFKPRPGKPRWGTAKGFKPKQQPKRDILPDEMPDPITAGEDILPESAIVSPPGASIVGPAIKRTVTDAGSTVTTSAASGIKRTFTGVPIEGAQLVKALKKLELPKGSYKHLLPKTPKQLTGDIVDIITLNPANLEKLKWLSTRVKHNIEVSRELLGKPGDPRYNTIYRNLVDAVEEQVDDIGYDSFIRLLGGVRSVRQIGSRDGNSASTLLQQSNLGFIYAHMLLIGDDTTAASCYELAQFAKQYDTDMVTAANDVTLGDLASYKSQSMIPVIATFDSLGDGLCSTESYYNAYTSATSVEFPPYILPVEADPSTLPKTYVFSDFIGGGTNYKHPFRHRVHNGRQCQVGSAGNPLLLRSGYMWDNTRLGGPTNIATFEKNPNNYTVGKIPESIILTLNASYNSELYLANRSATYRENRREAQNLVYAGAENVSIIIPTEVTEIPANAFTCDIYNTQYDPFTLMNVYTHVGLTKIGDRAFSRTDLQNITYPANTTIGAGAFAYTTPRICNFGTSGVTDYGVGSGPYTVELSTRSGSISRDLLTINSMGFARIYRNGVMILNDNVLPPTFPDTIFTGQRTMSLVPTAATTLTFTDAGNGGQVVINMDQVVSVVLVEETISTAVFGNNILVNRASTIRVTTDILMTPIRDSSGNILMDASGRTITQNIYVGTNQTDIKAYPNGVVRREKHYTVGGASFPTLTNIASISVQGLGTTRAIREIAETAVGERAFYRSGGMTRAFIPEGCVSIGESAYEDCEGMRELVCLPAGMRSVGARAFAGTNICGIVIPTSVTEIGEDAIPAGAKVILESDAEGTVTPAVAELLASLRKTNCVIVRSFDVLLKILPMAGSVPIRLERPPPAPSAVSTTSAEEGSVGVSWDMMISARDTPATSYVVRCWRDGTEEVDAPVYEAECSPYGIRGLEAGVAYMVSVRGVNGAGEGEANTVRVVA